MGIIKVFGNFFFTFFIHKIVFDWFRSLGFFRCSAKNENFKTSKQIQHSLEVVYSITPKSAKLLPALQNDELFVANASTLRLHCAPTTTATKEGNSVRWTFRKRIQSTALPMEVKTVNPNELHISNVSVEQHDGFYTCSFGSEHHQVSPYSFHFIYFILLLKAENSVSYMLTSEFMFSNNRFYHQAYLMALLTRVHLKHYHLNDWMY